jgi:hypothetical protein
VFTLWNGILTWRGEEPAGWEEWERRNGPSRSLMGSRRKYQTWLGAGHIGVLGGPGIALIGLGDGLRRAAGQGQDWWVWWVISIVAMGLISVSAIYSIVYFWFGVPDRLRPPAQRGWELVKGRGAVQVRPHTAGEHPKYRPPERRRRQVRWPDP